MDEKTDTVQAAEISENNNSIEKKPVTETNASLRNEKTNENNVEKKNIENTNNSNIIESQANDPNNENSQPIDEKKKKKSILSLFKWKKKKKETGKKKRLFKSLSENKQDDITQIIPVEFLAEDLSPQDLTPQKDFKQVDPQLKEKIYIAPKEKEEKISPKIPAVFTPFKSENIKFDSNEPVKINANGKQKIENGKKEQVSSPVGDVNKSEYVVKKREKVFLKRKPPPVKATKSTFGNIFKMLEDIKNVTPQNEPNTIVNNENVQVKNEHNQSKKAQANQINQGMNVSQKTSNQGNISNVKLSVKEKNRSKKKAPSPKKIEEKKKKRIPITMGVNIPRPPINKPPKIKSILKI